MCSRGGTSKEHRELGACCLTQIGFIAPLLDWVDECWPSTEAERADLFSKLRNSLADEAKYLARRNRTKPRPCLEPRGLLEFESRGAGISSSPSRSSTQDPHQARSPSTSTSWPVSRSFVAVPR